MGKMVLHVDELESRVAVPRLGGFRNRFAERDHLSRSRYERLCCAKPNQGMSQRVTRLFACVRPWVVTDCHEVDVIKLRASHSEDGLNCQCWKTCKVLAPRPESFLGDCGHHFAVFDQAGGGVSM